MRSDARAKVAFPLSLEPPAGTSPFDFAHQLLGVLCQAFGAEVTDVDVKSATDATFTVRVPVSPS